MHLAGLVHDLGKVMSVWGEEQWAVTGRLLSDEKVIRMSEIGGGDWIAIT